MSPVWWLMCLQYSAVAERTPKTSSMISPEMAAAEKPYISLWPWSMELQGYHTCQAALAFNHSPDAVLLSHPDLTSPFTTFMTKWLLSQLKDYFLKMCLLDSDYYKEWYCHFHDTWLQIYSTSGGKWIGSVVDWIIHVCSCSLNVKLCLSDVIYSIQ